MHSFLAATVHVEWIDLRMSFLTLVLGRGKYWRVCVARRMSVARVQGVISARAAQLVPEHYNSYYNYENYDRSSVRGVSRRQRAGHGSSYLHRWWRGSRHRGIHWASDPAMRAHPPRCHRRRVCSSSTSSSSSSSLKVLGGWTPTTVPFQKWKKWWFGITSFRRTKSLAAGLCPRPRWRSLGRKCRLASIVKPLQVPRASLSVFQNSLLSMRVNRLH